MTAARRTARACRITAAVLAITAALLAYQHWAYSLPGVVGAGVFLGIADSYRRDEQRHRARHARLEHAARADKQLLPFDDARRGLDLGCCETWWTSCGFQHDSTCPMQQRSAA
ncbi:hypothetical protein ACFUVV_01010 [Streptomyces sp. NPDC057376]|uniref:hypothetical protein n=1 Tax=Streptomyces sp. NPDC057376 TaxID=3346110 RepID=UPI0036303F2F